MFRSVRCQRQGPKNRFPFCQFWSVCYQKQNPKIVFEPRGSKTKPRCPSPRRVDSQGLFIMVGPLICVGPANFSRGWNREVWGYSSRSRDRDRAAGSGGLDKVAWTGCRHEHSATATNVCTHVYTHIHMFVDRLDFATDNEHVYTYVHIHAYSHVYTCACP